MSELTISTKRPASGRVRASDLDTTGRETPTAEVEQTPALVAPPLGPAVVSAATEGAARGPAKGSSVRHALLDALSGRALRTQAPAGEASVEAAYDALTVARGERAFARALERTRELVARGVQVVWAFDLDNTLYDTRARTLSIGKTFDAQHGTSYFSGVGDDLSRIGRDGAATAERFAMSPAHAAAFAALWSHEFWDPARLTFDRDLPDMIARAKAVIAAGGTLRYVTGRAEAWTDPQTGAAMSFRRDSLARIAASGLPADDAMLVLKPKPGGHTPTFKREALLAIEGQPNTVVAGFVTDTLHELLAMHHVDTIPCFWVRTTFELAKRPSTPPWVYSLPTVL